MHDELLELRHHFCSRSLNEPEKEPHVRHGGSRTKPAADGAANSGERSIETCSCNLKGYGAPQEIFIGRSHSHTPETHET
jgi:hypothetical protein